MKTSTLLVYATLFAMGAAQSPVKGQYSRWEKTLAENKTLQEFRKTFAFLPGELQWISQVVK